jgi:hypothetical protein
MMVVHRRHPPRQAAQRLTGADRMIRMGQARSPLRASARILQCNYTLHQADGRAIAASNDQSDAEGDRSPFAFPIQWERACPRLDPGAASEAMPGEGFAAGATITRGAALRDLSRTAGEVGVPMVTAPPPAAAPARGAPALPSPAPPHPAQPRPPNAPAAARSAHSRSRTARATD